jgi:hypothetical protein
MDEIKIFYFNNGMVIIGKPEYETTDVLDETITDLTKITSPRAIMVMQDANGRTVAQMIELFGKPDLSGTLESIGDALEGYVWANDTQIESWDGSRLHHDIENPRTEIIVRWK